MTINANQIGERESKTPTDSPLVLNNALSALSKPCDRKAVSQPNTDFTNTYQQHWQINNSIYRFS